MKFLAALAFLGAPAFAEQVVPPCMPFLDYNHAAEDLGYEETISFSPAPNTLGGEFQMFVHIERLDWIIALGKGPMTCPVLNGTRFDYTGTRLLGISPIQAEIMLDLRKHRELQ